METATRTRPKYMLEHGQFGVVELPYTYERRAQSTVHRIRWRQIAFGDDIDELEKLAVQMMSGRWAWGEWRILDWKNLGVLRSGK